VPTFTSIDTLNPGSRQIAVEEERDSLAGLHDLVVVVVNHLKLHLLFDGGTDLFPGPIFRTRPARV